MSQTPIEIIRSDRKSLAIQVLSPDRVVVRAPKRLSEQAIWAFVRQHEEWIRVHVRKAQARQAEKTQAVPLTEADLSVLRGKAASMLPGRVARFAAVLGVSYGRITIRAQKSRWGSCSSQGNLNFNCLLALCPEPVMDYVVVHELCHRKEMNHSPRFWQLVARLAPDYQASRRWLKQEGRALIDRLP